MRQLVTLANFAAAATVALVAAMLGLVAEDLLPVSGDRQTSGWRVGVLVVALVLLLLALLWRGRVHRRTGTLFYVRILDDVMPDRHTRALEMARRRRMSLRSVTQWVDLSGKTTTEGVVDVVAECERIAVALEAAVNNDRDDTAYTLAPNMLWPLALAVGAELPIVERLGLLELDDPGEGETLFALPSSWDGSAGTIVEVHEPAPDGSHGDGRVGLFLAFAKAAPKMPVDRVFVRCGVTEYYRLRPAWVAADLVSGASWLTPEQLANLAASLPTKVAAVKKRAGDRELVVLASMPKTLAVALGWGLAHSDRRFFAGTYLLHHDGDTDDYWPVRVHSSQPAGSPYLETR